MRRWVIVPLRIAATACLSLLLIGCHARSGNQSEERTATRTADIVVLHPTNVSFRIPTSWLEWDKKFHNNLHLTRSEIDHIRTGSGEWDSEYSRVVNAALPIEDCAAHVGGEGWGQDGVSFGDLQMRAYVMDNSVTFVIGTIVNKAKPIANQIGENNATVAISEIEGWKMVTLDYPLWYGDYGGTATVQFYVRAIGSKTLALVFMVAKGGQGQSEIRPILESVSIPK